MRFWPERLSRSDRINERAADIFGLGLVANFNQASGAYINGRFAFKPLADLISTFAASSGNALGQKGRVTHNRQNRNAMAQSFRRANYFSRDIDDRCCAFLKRSEACAGDPVAQAMGAPAQGKISIRFGLFEMFKIHRIMVFCIRLRGAGNHATWKNEPSIIDQSIARMPNQRVFAAARWANNKHKRTIFNIGLLQGRIGHGG